MNNNISAINIRRTKALALTALFFAVSVILAAVENALPSFSVPGIRLGLSNIIVMYALFFFTKRRAFAIAVLKSMFILMTRGIVAGFLSLFGGIISILVMSLLMVIFKEKISYLMLSIFGAIAHNLGQFTAVSIIFAHLYMWAYLPVLFIAGVAAGAVTSTILRFIIPCFKMLE